MSTPTLLDRLANLRSALVSDCLDRSGARHQAMASRLRPLFAGARVVGRARTVHAFPVEAVPAERSEWYRGELEAIDQLRRDDVLVVSTCPDGPFFGELLATAARYRGVRGAVIDAATRDTEQLHAMRFPLFVTSVNPLDSLGRLDVDGVGVPVECGGVLVHTGDLVIGDADGVVVIPEAMAEEVLALAEEKATGEDVVRRALADGMPVMEAFRTYGVI